MVINCAFDYNLVFIKVITAIMKYSNQIKPISYLKAHASEVFRDLNEVREPMVITQNGEAKAVLQDVRSYEETQETLALLKILALGEAQVQAGQTVDAASAIEKIRRGHQQD